MQKHKRTRGIVARLAAAVFAAALLVPVAAFAETTLEYDPSGNPVADNVTRIEVNKLEKGSRDYVKGAHLQIINKATGEVVQDWISDGNACLLEKVLDVDTTYVLHEVSAPEGYAVAADTEFVLHSEDFNTTGQILSGADAEFSTVAGSGTEQAFVINLYDEATVTAERTTSGSTTTSRQSLAKTGDILNQPLIIGLAVGGLAIVAYGIYRKRKQQ